MFIENTTAAVSDAISLTESGDATVRVVVSDNYNLAGSGATADSNKKGTIMNFIAALRQNRGGLREGFPTQPSRGKTGSTTDGRCKFRPGIAGLCYIGNHNLQITNDQSMTLLATFSGAPISILLTNQNTTQGNPNQPVTTTAAAARITPVDFTGGYTAKGTQLKRKFFADSVEQVVDGFMMMASEADVEPAEHTQDSTEYYFNLLTDEQVSAKIACSCASTFNKDSYYIDIDFDCIDEQQQGLEQVYYDIYGSATSPEICNLPPIAQSTPFDTLVPATDDECEDNE